MESSIFKFRVAIIADRDLGQKNENKMANSVNPYYLQRCLLLPAGLKLLRRKPNPNLYIF